MVKKLLCFVLCFLGLHKPIYKHDCKEALYYLYKCEHCKQWFVAKK